MNPSASTTHSRLRIIFRLLGVARQTRPGSLALYLLGAVAEISAFLVSIFATAKLGALVAQYITGGSTATSKIWFWLYVDIAAAVFIGLAFWLMSYAKQLLYFSTVKWVTLHYFEKICSIDFSDFQDENTRNQINKIESGYTWQVPNLSEAILELIYGVLRFLAITVIVAQISWWLVPLIAAFLVPSLLAEGRVARLKWFVWDAMGDQRHVFWGLNYIFKQARGQLEIRSLQAKKYLVGKIDTMNEVFYREQEEKYRHATKMIVPSKVFEVAGTAVGSIVVLKQVLAHSISLDRYFFLSGALLRIGGALNNIFSTLTRMQEPLLFAENYFAFIDKPILYVDTPNAVRLSKDKIPEILFEDVCFTYPGQTRPVFENLNLIIRPSEHIAIIGENGAGKSTLIKLLLRFYKPTSGRILLDGQDLQEIAIDSWYGVLATLFQEFNQYPFPIAENITVGRPDNVINDKNFHKAAKLAGVDKMVDKYKHGWDTVLDSSFEKGTEPSGGQWQKIALARAFYRDAHVLILDEPTAAIDAKAEYDIFNNIFEHYGNRTALIISHRFSTVRRAGRIVVLDKGKIVGEGSHQELMKQKGLYEEMFSKQAEGYRN